jgi:hypothetical protein
MRTAQPVCFHQRPFTLSDHKNSEAAVAELVATQAAGLLVGTSLVAVE